MDFIDRLRNKPLKARKRIAFFTSAVITIIIFVIWATVLNFSSSEKKQPTPAAVGESSSNPFSVFAEVISKGWQGFVNNLGQISSSAKNTQSAVSTSTYTAPTESSDSVKITQ